jgi:hypothetical protein
MSRRRDSHERPTVCPACGAAVVRQHAVHLRGDVFHAHCVLYRSAGASRARGKEQAESR